MEFRGGRGWGACDRAFGPSRTWGLDRRAGRREKRQPVCEARRPVPHTAAPCPGKLGTQISRPRWQHPPHPPGEGPGGQAGPHRHSASLLSGRRGSGPLSLRTPGLHGDRVSLSNAGMPAAGTAMCPAGRWGLQMPGFGVPLTKSHTFGCRKPAAGGVGWVFPPCLLNVTRTLRSSAAGNRASLCGTRRGGGSPFFFVKNSAGGQQAPSRGAGSSHVCLSWGVCPSPPEAEAAGGRNVRLLRFLLDQES